MNKCKRCGNPLPKGRTVFCSYECYVKHDKSKRNNGPIDDRICVKCGNTFTPKQRTQIFCHNPCVPSYVPVKKEKKTCVYCGKEFEGKKAKKFCSIKCSGNHSSLMYERAKQREMDKKPRFKRICLACGKEILTRKQGQHACSNNCTTGVAQIISQLETIAYRTKGLRKDWIHAEVISSKRRQ